MTEADDPADQNGRPDPGGAGTPAEFVAAMRRLKHWTGKGFRHLEQRAEASGHLLPRSTLTAALSRDSLPREELLIAFVSACGCADDEIERWVATRRRIAATHQPDPPDPAPVPHSTEPARPGGPGRKPVGVALAVLAMAALAMIAVWILTNPGGGGQTGPSAPPVSVPSFGRNQPCPDGWLCLYEHPQFNRDADGRMLKFQDDYWQRLREWGFDEQTSSARNRLPRDSCLSRQWPADAARLTLAAGSDTATLGTWNDQASGVKPGPC
ncbi:MAG TPA: peptidase inhibitor family I36 protein [Pseudonocardiaceae bacterium]|nr:peptidase inhibitor family I36 protein [Pseudonocardiaceae bacterium]